MGLPELLTDPTSHANVLVGQTPFYLSGEDNLQIRVFNTATVTLAIVGRILRPTGQIVPFVETMTPNTAGTLDTKLILLTEGWLHNLSIVVTSGTPSAAACYAIARIVRGGTVSASVQNVGTVAQGFVTASVDVSWPVTAASGGSSSTTSTFRTVVGTDPAAGSQISETVPSGKRWRIMGLSATLTTSAAVASRQVGFEFDDGANIFFASSNNVGNHTAGYAMRYVIGDSLAESASTERSRQTLPANLWLTVNCRIRSVVAAMQAGDDWTAPIIQIEEV